MLISAFCLSASCFNVWWGFQLSAVIGSLHKRAIAEAIPTTRRQMNAELFNHHPHVLQSVQRQDKSFHRWLLDDFCSWWMMLQDWYLLLSSTHTVCRWQAGSRGNTALWRQLEELGITPTSRLIPGLLQLKGSSWYSCKAEQKKHQITSEHLNINFRCVSFDCLRPVLHLKVFKKE